MVLRLHAGAGYGEAGAGAIDFLDAVAGRDGGSSATDGHTS